MYRATASGYRSDSEEEEVQSYRMSDISQPASPSTSSYNKMSVDSEDARSIASTTSLSEKLPKQINHISKITHSTRFTQDDDGNNNNNNSKHKGIFREKRDPEKRSVHRRSSLLPKSKALLRVIDQAEEDTRFLDIEMRKEKELQQKITDPNQNGVPAASWTKVLDFPYYQCSKLNPEVEMTNLQLDNLPPPIQQTYRSIKRKASEDRFEPYPAFSLKRRAVSPSVSLSGSPILTGISSPPTSFCPSPSPNAASRSYQQKPVDTSFNLQDASGGLSRMSLSE
ncbi:hypothetical protein G6F70_003328 [Rhizopus microsporus]|uniref:Uncharacterized protein n=1 Tax=Rhizopus microsporus TaxID=58291 RepID=A0A1X0SEA0_RHIZD|nr:hypothetical protein G6F71_003065 [Rhizopus microsporus]KAG1201254.1 hypothetical protein G6F70_003328 [Rhizopus microsporus]KAG1213448.1 hypothetical protein G6F69_002810 [Rhizopus microsporus]KAG1235616.1 hypothetical protein G6F67_002628 [Rhizopus microsporus]KAG1267765.1 hypothetical protein G6F68_001659 [Rhizopus microsporus]